MLRELSFSSGDWPISSGVGGSRFETQRQCCAPLIAIMHRFPCPTFTQLSLPSLQSTLLSASSSLYLLSCWWELRWIFQYPASLFIKGAGRLWINMCPFHQSWGLSDLFCWLLLPFHVLSTAPRGTFAITLTVTENLAPSARLLLYTVHPHGEIVADSSWIRSDVCFKNKVKTFAYLLRAIAASSLLREQLGNYFIKSPALGMGFWNQKGTDVPGNMWSCPWNWPVCSDSDWVLTRVGRRWWPGEYRDGEFL